MKATAVRDNGSSVLENTALTIVSIVGMLSLTLPFLLSALRTSNPDLANRAVETSLLLAVIIAGSLLIAIGEAMRQPGAGSLSRSVALLGVLVAIDASLRLIPSFYGASPIFALMVLVGYVFGPRFGFVMGSLTLLLSAAVTAGVGPWLPFQMLCAGWVGLAAGWLPRRGRGWARIGVLAIFGAVSSFVYGALMNLYSWPFAAPGATEGAGLYWSPSLTVSETLTRYAAFYVTTSLAHDATRAAATALLLLVAGPGVLRLLDRYRLRTSWASPAPLEPLAATGR